MKYILTLLVMALLCGCTAEDYTETQANVTLEETQAETECETTAPIKRRIIDKETKNDEVEMVSDEVETVAFEVQEPRTEVEIVQEEVPQPAIPHYSIAGHVMPIEWQDFLYTELQKYGTEELAPYLQAQALQESRYNERDCTNGMDYGLFQYRLQWWKHHCEQAGVYGDADIYNPYTQIVVRANLASKVYLQTGSIEAVMKRHVNGGDARNEEYWLNEVSPWFSQIEQIE